MPPGKRDEDPFVFVGTFLGVVLILFGMFTVGQALWLNANGSIEQARVVAERHGTKVDFVRVQLTGTGHEVNLWAWTGAPKVDTNMTIIYSEGNDWAKDAHSFAPTWRLWIGFGLGLFYLCAPRLRAAWRARGSRTSEM